MWDQIQNLFHAVSLSRCSLHCYPVNFILKPPLLSCRPQEAG